MTVLTTREILNLSNVTYTVYIEWAMYQFYHIFQRTEKVWDHPWVSFSGIFKWIVMNYCNTIILFEI